MSPDQFSLAMRRLIPRAEVWLQRNREQHTTTMRVEVPSLHRERVVADLVAVAGSPDPQERLEQVAHSLVIDVQREAIEAYGLQAMLDAAREDGLQAVREHLGWLSDQINALSSEIEEMRDLYPKAAARGIERKAELIRAERHLRKASGVMT